MFWLLYESFNLKLRVIFSQIFIFCLKVWRILLKNGDMYHQLHSHLVTCTEFILGCTVYTWLCVVEAGIIPTDQGNFRTRSLCYEFVPPMTYTCTETIFHFNQRFRLHFCLIGNRRLIQGREWLVFVAVVKFNIIY